MFWDVVLYIPAREGELWLLVVLLADQVLRLDGVITELSFSLVLFRLKGLWLWKNPLFFLSTVFSGATCFIGDVFPLGGS